MPRTARICAPGLLYHLTHRGNRGDAVFGDRADRESYLWRLAKYAARHAMEVWAYCLMTNHVHLLVRGLGRHSLARAIGQAHGLHARWMNRRLGWSGHLWENRYYSTPLDEQHLWAAVRYVELNPVRAGMTPRAEDHVWSSAAAHCGLAPAGLLAPGRCFPGPVEDWHEWLASGLDATTAERLRANTLAGRPSGDAAFVRHLELTLRRALRRPRRGRPRRPARGSGLPPPS
jgi:putative transposase